MIMDGFFFSALYFIEANHQAYEKKLSDLKIIFCLLGYLVFHVAHLGEAEMKR